MTQEASQTQNPENPADAKDPAKPDAQATATTNAPAPKAPAQKTAEKKPTEKKAAEKKTTTKKTKSSEPAFYTLRTDKPEGAPFDLPLNSDVVLRGSWDNARAYVVWKCPAEHLDLFKMHRHYKTGRVIVLEELKED